MNLRFRRLKPGALAVLLLGLFVLNPGAAPAAVSSPDIAGTTTITAHGSAGIMLSVPANVTYKQSEIEFATTGTFGFAGVRIVPSYSYPGVCEICLDIAAERIAAYPWPHITAGDGNGDGDFLAGWALEIYFVGDGDSTLTLRFHGITGSVQLAATGSVEATVEKLPTDCPLPQASCLQGLMYGGVVHVAGNEQQPGLAAVAAFTEGVVGIGTGSDVTKGSAGVVGCAYPGFFAWNESPDPAKHPTGCNTTPEGTSLPDLADAGNNLIHLASGYSYFSIGNGRAHGPVYLGWLARDVDASGGGHVGAFGMWLTAGIGCPSGDFADCVAWLP